MQRRSLALLIAATFVLVVIAAVALGTGGHSGAMPGPISALSPG